MQTSLFETSPQQTPANQTQPAAPAIKTNKRCSSEKKGSKRTPYEKITDRIIEELEKGRIPWQKPWKGSGSGPVNPTTGTEYRGMNFFMLSMMPFSNPNWVTFKQAKAAGGKVTKGEKGTPIIFWNFMKKNAAGKWIQANYDDEDKRPVLKLFHVFNVEQCEGLPEKIESYKMPELKNIERIERAEALIKGYADGPEITESTGDRAFYRPSTDSITLPKRGQFEKPEGFYTTAFHEMAHSTGHQKRLSRETITSGSGFGSMDYGEEELIAELTAAYLCADAGIDNTITNSAAYIQSWLKVFRQPKNEKMIIKAAGAAQKAANYIRTGTAKTSPKKQKVEETTAEPVTA